MQKIRVLLVDDEYLALQLLESFLNRLAKDITEIELVAKVKSPLQAIEILQTQTIDLLFLDIEMPTLRGHQLLKALSHPPLTIFTTAYTDYAVQAFELNAIDYLVKPFSFERFVQAFAKARKHFSWRSNTTLSPHTKTPKATEPSQDEHLTIKEDGNIYKVFYQDIIYIEGLREYVRIVTHNRKFVTLAALKDLEATLPAAHFMRVHKSYIVALAQVVALNGNLLQLQGSYQIPVSRSRKEHLVKTIF